MIIDHESDLSNVRVNRSKISIIFKLIAWF